MVVVQMQLLGLLKFSLFILLKVSFKLLIPGELGSRSAIYGVANQCQGGIEYNNENIQIISNVLATAPGNFI